MREVIVDQINLAGLSSEILERGCYFKFKVKGFSMYPFIRDGDIVTVERAVPSHLNIGDVIFYEVENRLVVHRIVQKHIFDGKIWFTSRGDSSRGSEEKIFENAVLGKVVTLQRNSKMLKVNHGLSRSLVKCWLMLFPVGPLAMKFIQSIRRRIASLLK